MGNAITTLANPASVNDRIITYLSKLLLAVQKDELVLDQFALKTDLPKEAGSITVRFFKPEKAAAGLRSAPTDAATAALNALSEGVAPTTYRENNWSKVDVTLKQFGQVTKLSDVIRFIDAYNPVKQNINLMALDAALSFDSCIRNALVGGTHPGTGTPLTHSSSSAAATYGCEIFATASAGIFTPTSAANTSAALFTALSGVTAANKANAKFTRAGALSASTRLRTKKAPRLQGGNYVCVICPEHLHDAFQDADYKVAFQGRGREGIFKRELGTIDGITYVEGTNPYTEDETYGTYDAVDDDGDGLIYSSLFLGAGAYGVPKLAGTNHPLAPKVVILDKADKSDPLNQTVLAGWKAFYMAQGLDSDNIVNLRCKSTFA